MHDFERGHDVHSFQTCTFFPNIHFSKHENPYYDLDDLWEKWDRLVFATYDAVDEHKRLSNQVHGTDKCPPFVTPPELAAMAAGIGATWSNEKVSPVDLADPTKIMSQKRRQVLCCPPHV
jgi:hypothetical protein